VREIIKASEPGFVEQAKQTRRKYIVYKGKVVPVLN
jgi:hypothetical protein